MVPRATYRLQLTQDFPFAAAEKLAPYLARLGISHAYLSPILKAQPGSSHAYDVTDHSRINPELGTEEEFRRMVGAFRRHGLGVVVDIVPNHMGTGPDNPRWVDLLRWGRRSENAEFFDIDWDPPQPHLAGKVFLPVLDRPLDQLLSAGEISLGFDGETMVARRGEHQSWPLTPLSYGAILRAAGIDTLADEFDQLGEIEDPATLSQKSAGLERMLAERQEAHPALRALLTTWSAAGSELLRTVLDRQCWHIDDWRRSSTEINYRRFFAINDLAAIRADRIEVFEASHALILRLVGERLIDGLRIDHVDGLADPKQYLDRLAAAMAERGCAPCILVEKILASDETLPADWPVMGTTGYDRIGPVDRLFVDPEGAQPLVRTYGRLTGRPPSPAARIRSAKRRFLDTDYASEVGRLARFAAKLAERYPTYRPLSVEAIASGFKAVVAQLPVYRTYLDRNGATGIDRRRLIAALDAATLEDELLVQFLYAVLIDPYELDPEAVLEVQSLFQQISGPAMAKGLEDTVFFQYVPLLALNEVGGEADVEPGELPAFHAFNEAQGRRFPHSLIAGSTHDTKRGEDARARLLCLSSVTEDWDAALVRWRGANGRFIRNIAGRPAPGPNGEYYVYQSLIGAWPPGLQPTDRDGLASFKERLRPAMVKAVREAKERTNWNDPDDGYEAALGDFIDALLDPDRSAQFLADLSGFCERIGFWGALTSLSASLLRHTTPGIPDVYQGSEGWNLSLVDPDNRRPVDYEAAAARLDQPVATALRGGWRDGAAKSFLIRRVLELRRAQPDLFAEGSYTPLEAQGEQAACLIAFARQHEGSRLIALAPRFWPRLWPDEADAPRWGGTRIALPAGDYRNVLTGASAAGCTPIRLADLLEGFPVGLFATGGIVT
ncbi:MAG TPA: malto-oligosyltrehalose synthase [Aliidongia sp.]|nr:malto-oligosyltrehalose synthase [Aliidongia sp.]